MATETETQNNPQPNKMRRTGGFLFIPRSLQRSEILIWLRRTHAWTGVYGALFFFCLGLSGFYLNHRTSIMHIDGGTSREVADVSVILNDIVLSTEKDLAEWMKKEFSIGAEPSAQRGSPGGAVNFGGKSAVQAKTISVTFRGPNSTITGTHEVGSNVVHLKKTNPSLLKAIIDLHKVAGVGALFILIMDTMAGAMVFMSVSGILLWTRLHGPRLAAIGILSAVAAMTALALSGTWVAWSAP